MELGELLKKLRNEKKYSLVKLEELSGVTQGYISDIENQSKNKKTFVPKKDKLDSLIKALKPTHIEKSLLIDLYADLLLTEDMKKTLLENKNENSEKADNLKVDKVIEAAYTIPFFPDFKAAAGRGKLNFEYSKEELEVPKKFAKSNFIACVVEGDSMEPDICEGDILILDTNEPSKLNNKIFVIWKDGEIFLKEIIDAGDMIILHSRNGAYKPISVKKSEIQIVGRVVATYREY